MIKITHVLVYSFEYFLFLKILKVKKLKTLKKFLKNEIMNSNNK